MAKTKVEKFCYSCDVTFEVRYSEEETFLDPVHCVFCGDELDDEDINTEEDDDGEEKDHDEYN